MRSDMDEVVIERPRVRARYSYRDFRVRTSQYKNNPEALDDLPKHQGYRRPYGWDSKQFNDFLNPLKRFLESRVGHKWDDVYSEIREHINPNSTVQAHILGHVRDFIETETWIDKDTGEVVAAGWLGRPYRISYGGLYVHPITGLVTVMPPTRKHHPFRSPEYKAAAAHLSMFFGRHWANAWHGAKSTIEAAANHVMIGLEHEFHKIDGIWYRAIFADVPPPFTDIWLDNQGQKHEKVVRRAGEDFITGVRYYEGRYRSYKQQASRRELRRYGMENTR